MIFIFDEHAGDQHLCVKSETFKYLIKVRRHSVGDIVSFRRADDPDTLHLYELQEISGREACFVLKESRKESVSAAKTLHIGWCVIDSKSVEKVLPQLNEIGVSKITFIECDRSQKNFRHDFKRYERILESSMQQCGRTELMEFAIEPCIKSFLEKNPDCAIFDFCDHVYGGETYETVLIGAEGGFSKDERHYLTSHRVFRLETPMVLRSETAAVAVASKILL